MYLVRGADVIICKWVTVLVDGEHGETRKHGQTHSYPQANHVHVQRPKQHKKNCNVHQRSLAASGSVYMALLGCSHLSVSQAFAGDVALHLGLVDRVDGHPHHAATN